MSKIFDLGRTPEEWSAKLRPRGVELSPRTLGSGPIDFCEAA